jgi:hypothetical protein
MKKLVLAALLSSVTLAGVSFAQTTTVVVPGEVRTYVLEQSSPSVVYDGAVVVGEPLPEAVEIYPVSEQSGYGYVVLNQKRVLVDPQTRQVIEVLE